MGMDVQQGRNTSSRQPPKMVMSYDHKIKLANDIPKRRHD
jgi:hypothetical protein